MQGRSLQAAPGEATAARSAGGLTGHGGGRGTARANGVVTVVRTSATDHATPTTSTTAVTTAAATQVFYELPPLPPSARTGSAGVVAPPSVVGSIVTPVLTRQDGGTAAAA